MIVCCVRDCCRLYVVVFVCVVVLCALSVVFRIVPVGIVVDDLIVNVCIGLCFVSCV